MVKLTVRTAATALNSWVNANGPITTVEQAETLLSRAFPNADQARISLMAEQIFANAVNIPDPTTGAVINPIATTGTSDLGDFISENWLFLALAGAVAYFLL